MPVPPKQPCRHPGCGALAQGKPYCEKHEKDVKNVSRKRFDKTRPSSAKRGYSWKWQKLRKVKLRQNPICEADGCDQPASEVDHIVPMAQGGGNESENLQALCKACHSRKTALQDSRFVRRDD